MATENQKRLFEKVVQKAKEGKKIVMYKEMKGIYKNTTSTKIVRSQGWKELLETYLPDSILTQKHLEGLHATKKEGNETVTDYAVIAKYLDMGYKVKNKYPKEQINNNFQFNFNQDRNEFQ